MIESGNEYVTKRGWILTRFFIYIVCGIYLYDIITYNHYTDALVLGSYSAVNLKVNQTLDVIIFTPCEKLKNLVRMYVDAGQDT